MNARRLLLLTGLSAVLVLAGADAARACSCADIDPRDRLEEGYPAMSGRVVEATHDDPPGSATYVVEVERALNVRLGDRVEISAGLSEAGCGFRWREGRRVAAFIHRARGGRWTSNLCSLTTPGELVRATEPYPRPLGRGRVALLAGGSFGDARLMALDERGRILGYGFGEGSVRRLSVCPGGGAAAELVDRGPSRSFVVVRSLESLRVLSAAAVPRHTSDLTCAGDGGATVYAGGIDYGRRGNGRAEVFRIAGSSRSRVLARPADQLALGPGSAYLAAGSRVLAASLPDGGTRAVLTGQVAHQLVPSPDGGRLAVLDFDRGVWIVDTATGGVSSRPLRPWALGWIAPDRLLVRVNRAALTFDAAMRPQRRYGGYAAVHHAALGDALFGMDRYRLLRLDLTTGAVRTARRLPDRGIAELVAVPGGPELEVPRRAPTAIRPAAAVAGSGPLCPLP
ncbi:MAG TPA: hypothetical protein VFY52_07515 [Thermoleophilaceae bacterium]|nr:hypothetical protein [Thermoleophilaceae bacterium]